MSPDHDSLGMPQGTAWAGLHPQPKPVGGSTTGSSPGAGPRRRASLKPRSRCDGQPRRDYFPRKLSGPHWKPSRRTNAMTKSRVMDCADRDVIIGRAEPGHVAPGMSLDGPRCTAMPSIARNGNGVRCAENSRAGIAPPIRSSSRPASQQPHEAPAMVVDHPADTIPTMFRQQTTNRPPPARPAPRSA